MMEMAGNGYRGAAAFGVIASKISIEYELILDSMRHSKDSDLCLKTFFIITMYNICIHQSYCIRSIAIARNKSRCRDSA